jgi:succinate dehydrogenase/fumarate reductase cytochrome b subunit
VHPTRRSTLVLFVAAVVLYILSPSGQAGSYWENGPSWLGSVGWFGFLICLLLLVCSGLYVVVSRIRHRHRPSTS